MHRSRSMVVGALGVSALLLTAACADDSPTAPSPNPEPSRSLRLAFDGLEALGDGYVYEGWILTDAGPLSTGTFTVTAGRLSRSTFEVDQAALRSASKFVLTIEPSPDDDPGPAKTKYLGGNFDGNSAMLTVADELTLNDDFMSAAGTFFLAAPSAAMGMGSYMNGIWWAMTPMPLSPSLSLPALPDGWMYEGWVVVNGMPTTTGRFSQAMGADSDGGGPYKGPMGTPPFPGQDFVMPPMSLIGGAAVISVEPEPDDSPGPFTLKPLIGHMIADDMGTHMSQMMDNHAGDFPTGMATR